MFVFRVLNTVPYSNQAGAKDVIACLHSFVTCNLLVGFAVLVSWKQFGGKPMECMVPTDFTNAWAQYAENYCWAQDTYFVPPSVQFANTDDEELPPSAKKVSYYQWMPFFLLFEAACFKLPCLIWKYFASQSGMRVGEILRLASDDHNAVPEVKKGNVEALCTHLQGALRFQKRLQKRKLVPHKVFRFLNVKYSSFYVVFIYFIAKFCFLINVGLQTKLLTRYLLPHDEGKSLGFDVWRRLFSGNETWQESGLFPRVTMCDFEVREMANLQTHTVQCMLLINILTEKIFIILWAWYLILGALTTCNLFSWAFVIFSETSKEHFIINHLEMCETPFDRHDTEDREAVDRFIDLYLGLDGIFLLQLIAQHADVVFTTELVSALWRSHLAIEEQKRAIKQMDMVLPLLGRNSNSDHSSKKNSENGTPDGPRIRNPRRSIAGPRGSLQRTTSFDDVELSEIKRYGDSSDEDMEKGLSSRSDSKKGSPTKRRTSKA